jgi:hypothetical protein
VQPFADLLMREMVAVFQSVLAVFDGFDEAVFFFEIAGNNVLHKVVRVAALLVRTLCEAGLQLGFEMNFHAFTIGYNQSTGNGVMDELRGRRWVKWASTRQLLEY